MLWPFIPSKSFFSIAVKESHSTEWHYCFLVVHKTPYYKFLIQIFSQIKESLNKICLFCFICSGPANFCECNLLTSMKFNFRIIIVWNVIWIFVQQAWVCCEGFQVARKLIKQLPVI